MAFPWDEHWHQELKRMLAEGLLAKSIATALTAASGVECTRNAVIGKTNRLGIAGETKSSRTRLEHKEEAAARAEAKAQIERERAVQPEGFNNICIPDLKNGHCRYPVAGAGRDTVFCGEDRGAGPYCEYHHEICTQAPNTFRPRNSLANH